MGELLREFNATGDTPETSPLGPERLVQLLQLVEAETVSLKVARDLFPEFYASGKDAEQLVQDKGLVQVSDERILESMIEEALIRYPEQAEQYRAGKETVLGFLVGQVMKASQGKANPGKVNALLKRHLTS
jgi:aspartyl-tRNA(Asn)/glutamyl-tRNA(Gln) amidotransferase subunit B